MRPQPGAQLVDRDDDRLRLLGAEPPVLDEPGPLGLDRAHDVEVADPLHDLAGLAVGHGVDRGDEGLEDDPLDVRPGREQQVGLRVVEDREPVGVLLTCPAQPHRERLEQVLLAVLEEVELTAPIGERVVAVTTGRSGDEALDERAADGPLDDPGRHLASAEEEGAPGVELVEGVLVLGEHALGHELQQDGVVALEGAEDVGVGLEVGEAVDRHVAGAAARLAAHLDRVGGVLGGQCLDARGPGLELALRVLARLLARRDAVHLVDEGVLGQHERERPGEPGQELALVAAVVEDPHLALAVGGVELRPVQAVDHGQGERGPGRGAGAARDGDAATDEGAEHREEAAARVLDRRVVATVVVDRAVAVEQVEPGHADVVEGQLAVVDAAQAHLRAAVTDGHAVERVAVLVADRDEDAVDAVVLAVDDELGEDRGHTGVAGSVADVVLARRDAGGVDLDLVGLGHVRRGREERLHVGAVAELGHGEGPEQRAVEHAGQVGIPVPLRPEVGDRPAEEPELHTGLDEDGEVGVPEHLEGGDGRPVLVRPALLLGQAVAREVGLGQLEDGLEGPLPVLVEGERRDRWCEGLGVEPGAHLLAHLLPAPVEHGPDLFGGTHGGTLPERRGKWSPTTSWPGPQRSARAAAGGRGRARRRAPTLRRSPTP